MLGSGALGGVPGGLVNEGGVGGLRGPDPFTGRRGALAAAPAEHHVSGVFGVGQEVMQPRGGPAAVGAGGGVALRVGVEPCGDRRQPQAGFCPPLEDAGHHGPAYGVDGEAGFGAAVGVFGGVGVGVAFGGVPVGDGAEVPAGQGMFFQPVPDFFFQLQPVPFRDALLDPADQDRGRVDPVNMGGLIGGEQRNTLIVKFPFQFQRIERVPRDCARCPRRSPQRNRAWGSGLR